MTEPGDTQAGFRACFIDALIGMEWPQLALWRARCRPKEEAGAYLEHHRYAANRSWHRILVSLTHTRGSCQWHVYPMRQFRSAIPVNGCTRPLVRMYRMNADGIVLLLILGKRCSDQQTPGTWSHTAIAVQANMRPDFFLRSEPFRRELACVSGVDDPRHTQAGSSKGLP